MGNCMQRFVALQIVNYRKNMIVFGLFANSALYIVIITKLLKIEDFLICKPETCAKAKKFCRFTIKI